MNLANSINVAEIHKRDKEIIRMKGTLRNLYDVIHELEKANGWLKDQYQFANGGYAECKKCGFRSAVYCENTIFAKPITTKQ